MPRGTPVPITPEVLDWAIRTSGYGENEVAEKLGISTSTLKAWLSGAEKPGLTLLRHLAAVLKRPLATFLLPNSPRSATIHVEFRHPPGNPRRHLNAVEATYLREASRLQRGLAWIQSQIGESPVPFPSVSTADDHERVAEEERQRIRVSIEEQLQWDSSSQALRAWRRAFEERGIVVCFFPMGKNSSRGFSLWNEYAPLLAVNTHWNYQARTFTLLHEYAHLITRTSSSCVGHVSARIRPGEDQVERWCERFAAAFLAPWRAIESLLTQKLRWRFGTQIEDIGIARKLANSFHISVRAMTLRLIDHGVATWDLYRQIPEYVDDKSGGGGGGGRSRLQIRRDEYGDQAARVMIRGLEKDVLSRTDVLSYLDVADSDLDSLASLMDRRRAIEI